MSNSMKGTRTCGDCRFFHTFFLDEAIMTKLTQFAIVTSMLCFLCSSAPRLAVAGTRPIWTGDGENNDVLNPDKSQPVTIEVVAEDEGEGNGAADSTGVEPEDGRALPPGRTTVRGEVVDGDGRTLGLSTGSFRTSQQLSTASAVVRVKMVSTEDNDHIIVYRITKLVYGRFPGRTLRQFDGFASVRFEEGREVTLYVYPQYQRKDGTFNCGVHYGALDEGDKRILEIVKSGTHLLPGKGPHDLAFFIRTSQRVVRAKLVKLDDVASHWDVSQTVCSSSKYPSNTPGWRVVPRSAGTGAREKQPRITLSMTPWRLRAEAIVRAQAAQQTDLPQQTDPKQTEKQIKEEFNRLVSADLKIGREAILFLCPNDDPAEEALYSPAFVFPADPDNPGYLDQLDKKIRGIIERGEHKDVYS